jgi:heme/copper-type cytochrome/quinol oxidase subunit 4
MKSTTDMILWAIGLLAFVLGLWQLMLFLGATDAKGNADMWAGTTHLWTAIAAAIVACACVAWAFTRRPHVQEEIHITE